MKMAPYEAFACRCGKRDVLQESYQPNTRGKLSYACPRSKPKENDFGCKFFLWKEERVRLLISSPGSSSTPSYSSEPSSPNTYSSGTTTPQNHHSGTSISGGCSNCKHLLAKIKVLEAAVEMHMHPEQHTRNSTALLHELYNDMDNLDSNFSNKNEPWEYSLDIDDSDLRLTPVVRSSSSTHVEPSSYTTNPVTIIPGPSGFVQLSSSTRVEPSTSTLNPVRIIPGPAGLVQQVRLLKEKVFILDPDRALMSTQQYMDKVVEDVDEDDNFKSVAWLSTTNYVNAFGGTLTGCLGDVDNFLKKGKLEQVVGIVKSCSPNMLGDLNVTLKDLSGTIPGTIHHNVIGKGCYGKNINVDAAMILKMSLFLLPNHQSITLT
ncbi:hypothetical protein Tco_0915836 [Tanacetum coccineum]